MFDPQWWADEMQSIVAAIPRAQGEDQDHKVARIARYAQISRATLFNILAGKPTRLMNVVGWLKLLQMIPASKSGIRDEHVEKILQVSGISLEHSDQHSNE